MASSAASNSTLTRYRPYVLTVAGFAAAFSIYHLTSILTTPAGNPPRRRNAVHNPRRRRRRRSVSPSPTPSVAEHGNVPHSGDTMVGENNTGSGDESGEMQQHTFQTGLMFADLVGTDAWTLRDYQQFINDHPIDPNLDADAFERRDHLGYFVAAQVLERALGEQEYSEQNSHLVADYLRSQQVRENLFSEDQLAVPRQMGRSWIDRSIGQPLRRAETVADTDSSAPSAARPNQRPAEDPEAATLTQLLYHIGEDKARQEGYIHRGVTCNRCDLKPIRGIRWHCTNCLDYDLCSNCEALGLHDKTHLFYKIKIPAPFIGSPQQVQPVIYPGNPGDLPNTLPQDLKRRMHEDSKFEFAELDAMWDLFSCLANRHDFHSDPCKFGAAFDRTSFDKAFLPFYTTSPKRNWVYTRLFAFFDTNQDQLVGFEEFVRGMSILQEKQGAEVKLKAVFDGYDADMDGFVSRKDFLHMFRSYFAIQSQLTRDHLWGEEEHLNLSEAVDHIAGAQPLSGMFNNAVPYNGDAGRVPDAKQNVDIEANERSVWQPSALDENVVKEDSEDKGSRWEVFNGHEVANVEEWSHDRWRRRKFYIDEEEGAPPPPDYEAQTDQQAMSSKRDTPNDSRPVSPRSRSSSKVRFLDQDDVELETRSNASTSSRPVGERWGGYEVPEDEQDLGSDIFYQVMQEGLNELLDPLFGPVEDLAMEAEKTKDEREKYASAIELYKKVEDEKALKKLKAKYSSEASDPLLETAAAVEQGTSAGSRSPHSPTLGSSWTTESASASDDSDASSTRPTHISSVVRVTGTALVDATGPETSSTDAEPAEDGVFDLQAQLFSDMARQNRTQGNTDESSGARPVVQDTATQTEVGEVALHVRQSVVSNFEETIDQVAQRAQESPLEDLLADTGYTVDKTLPDPPRDLQSLHDFVGYRVAADEVPDTQYDENSILPHRRPNTPELSRSTGNQGRPTRPSMTEEEFVRHPAVAKRIARLIELNLVDKANEQRGGAGKMNFAEFSNAVGRLKETEDEHRRPIAFIEEWLDVGQL